MPVIKSKMIRVRDPQTGFWHDLPATVSEESFRAAERALESETSAAASAASAASSAGAASSSATDAATSASAAASSASDAAAAKTETIGYAETAAAKASDAQSYAGDAQEAAVVAESYKETAVAKAAAAALSEQNAAASASAASSSETAAEGYATSAEADASDAASSASAAASSATAAASSASSAEASATSAAASASAAGTSAAAAADSATAAAASAQAAESSVLGSNFAPYITNTLTAPANITAGEYVVAAGVMYRATANIASGSTLTPNGNVSAVTVGEELTKVIASDARKADADGTSPNLTAGNALQLVSTVGIEDQVPYNFRASGGGADIGDRETDMIVGGTVAWNQIVQDGDFADGSGWKAQYRGSSISVSDGVASVKYVSGAANASNPAIHCESFKGVLTHKYLIDICVMPPVTNNLYFGGNNTWGLRSVTAGEWNDVTFIREATALTTGGNLFSYIGMGGYSAMQLNDELKFRRIRIHDLTQMFGATIADYIYSLEQANAGDGVAWFKKLFPNDYYAYDAGTLRSVQTSAHKMVGFNAFDKNASDVTIGKYIDDDGSEKNNSIYNITGYIPVVGGQTYYFADTMGSSANRNLVWYDSGKNIISVHRTPYTGSNTNLNVAPLNAMYVRVTVAAATKWNTYVVNLSWDGERDGEYEPYVEHSYALDDSLTLRGVPTLDANNKLRYDGDTYASDGTVTRRCAEQTFVGARGEAWSIYQFAAEMPRYAFFIQPAIPRNKSLPNTELVASGVEVNASAAVDSGMAATTISARFGASAYTFYISIPRSQFSGQTLQEVVAEFKVWLASHPVSITYERETYVTESADPYTNPQIVSDWGTEEYVDAGVEAGARDVAIPVGHETFYQANLRAKLEAAPDSPDGDGDYILRQTGGENVYVPFVTDTTMNVSGKAADAAAVGVGMRNLLGVLQELAGVLGDTTLPAMPDGTYILKATVTNGEVSYSWIAET